MRRLDGAMAQNRDGLCDELGVLGALGGETAMCDVLVTAPCLCGCDGSRAIGHGDGYGQNLKNTGMIAMATIHVRINSGTPALTKSR